jgi:hypothetical protein
LSLGYGFVERRRGRKESTEGYSWVLLGWTCPARGRGVQEDEKGKAGKLSSKSKTAKMIVKNDTRDLLRYVDFACPGPLC